MGQLTKLHESIFVLLTWTDCSSEFIIENYFLKKASQFAEYFEMHIKMHILK